MFTVRRLGLWLVAVSLAVKLLVALIPVPLERTLVDASAPTEDSDYVTVRGLPRFFLVPDTTVHHRPTAATLLSHFAYDWLFFFCASAGIVAVVMLVRSLIRAGDRYQVSS